MAESEHWLSYFRANRGRPSPRVDPAVASLDPRLHAVLAPSLGRFWLGESGEGRVAKQAAESSDPALDDAMRESIALYVREEGRHAREIADVLSAMHEPLPGRHWSESLFRRGRRLLGLRTKMMTIAAAEVVGAVYYEMLSEGVPAMRELAAVIAREEREHLGFQGAYFERVCVCGRPEARTLRVGMVLAGFAVIAACAVATFLVSHGGIVRELGVTRGEIAKRCAREAWTVVARVTLHRAGAMSGHASQVRSRAPRSLRVSPKHPVASARDGARLGDPRGGATCG